MSEPAPGARWVLSIDLGSTDMSVAAFPAGGPLARSCHEIGGGDCPRPVPLPVFLRYVIQLKDCYLSEGLGETIRRLPAGRRLV